MIQEDLLTLLDYYADTLVDMYLASDYQQPRYIDLAGNILYIEPDNELEPHSLDFYYNDEYCMSLLTDDSLVIDERATVVQEDHCQAILDVLDFQDED